MSHVFISYSHKDQEYATQLAQTLEMEGYTTWIDNRGIDYGAHWPHVIQEALDTCTAFIVVMSPNAFDSQWVQNELSRAQRKQKPILPLLLDGDEPWLMVESTQYADVRGGKMPPKKFYERLGKVLPRKQHDPQDSGYFVFNLDSEIPERVVAEPPPLAQKPRGVLRETGSHQQVNAQPTESGWFTPDSASSSPPAHNPPLQSPNRPQQQYQQQPPPQHQFAGHQQPYAQQRPASSGIPGWLKWGGLATIGFIGLIILAVIIIGAITNNDNGGDDASQVDVAEDFLRAVIEGNYSHARNLAASSCPDATTVIDFFQANGVVGTISNLSCNEHGTDTVYCEYLVDGTFASDTIYFDGNKVCSFE